ncbi:hypothetical protein A2415_02370 [candidate division WWE3 bacterium RIFOXYC1_FULL_39_7]|uniref:Adenylate kinase n=2 Tax=Katanobacteria TaxID=422282 RepID=A0A1F4X5W1_UNCKA|nr:MAG: hypothetical protein A2415_02370 [candidate division WWE3 bacterium RIFOXYC1_FULL_39_7]OGC77062.1 MAG: hypothetical protein A2619_01545 [candidate division WWE3 bacterium RIFOXYD1_FULL_39_9]
MKFDYYNSKILSNGKTYVLTDPARRRLYFEAKLGSKIDEVKEYLDHNSFVGYLLAKKQAGKGMYSKMVEEILGSERFAHISVGDVVRSFHEKLNKDEDVSDVLEYLKLNYRGFMSIDESISALRSRTTDKVSVPAELILTLLKMEIDKIGKKGLFIDGLPRTLDQISYSLYFRDLINYRDDPDFFVLINIPLELIDIRMKSRVVCPICQTSRNTKLSPTSILSYDSSAKQVKLLCDNSTCSGYGKAQYVIKEGDASGILSISERLKTDEELMQKALNLHGIPKILIESAIPVEVSSDYLEDYEIQPAYEYEISGEVGKEKVISKTAPLTFKNDSGDDCHTMYAATYVVNIFDQLHKTLLG